MFFNPSTVGLSELALFIGQVNKYKCSYPTCMICKLVMWVVIMWNCFLG